MQTVLSMMLWTQQESLQYTEYLKKKIFRNILFCFVNSCYMFQSFLYIHEEALHSGELKE
jgi:hypothetical protein